MDDTDHSVSQQTPSVLPTSHGAFDYGDLDAETAQVLREAAGAIQKIQHAAIADVGRHLARARDVLDHGQFLKWAKQAAMAELSQRWFGKPRTSGTVHRIRAVDDTGRYIVGDP
jgi:hypothetical protein